MRNPLAVGQLGRNIQGVDVFALRGQAAKEIQPTRTTTLPKD